jgi:hypothetical protein
VEFPGTPGPECPGPNYIVQDYAVDWAIVQTQNWSTLYILSRERLPKPATLEVSLPLPMLSGELFGEEKDLLTVCRLGFSVRSRLGRMRRRLLCLSRRDAMMSRGGGISQRCGYY